MKKTIIAGVCVAPLATLGQHNPGKPVMRQAWQIDRITDAQRKRFFHLQRGKK